MIAVIIAGGSGTRLWPLSTPDYPKHLLSLTNENSLLKNTLNRARKLTTDDKIFIIPEISHTHHVAEQLQDFPKDHILSEPARRGTASCIIRALQHLKKSGFDENQPVGFLWADHLVRDERGFVRSFSRAGKLVSKYQKNVFIGVEPTYASSALGYLHCGEAVNGEDDAFELMEFKEKPDSKTAKRYIESGEYLWNTGYLVTSVEVFERDAEKFAKGLKSRYDSLVNADDVDAVYLNLESEAIDYAYSEKLQGSLVMAGTFDWVDFGSFADLHSISEQDDVGNHLKGNNIEVESTTNSFIRNETNMPVAVIGLDNVVVVNTPNGILVTNKNYAQRVGEISKRFQKN